MGGFGDDAGQPPSIRRLEVIGKLEHAIARLQIDLQAARHALETAQSVEERRRAALASVDAEIAEIDRQVHRRGSAAYLDGDALDRGAIELTNVCLRYTGWRGRVSIPLRGVVGIELGTSRLPPRAGLPALGRVWPGRPREAGTILLTVRSDEQSEQRLAVIADVADAPAWREAILERRRALDEVVGRRRELFDQREAAAAAHEEAADAVARAMTQVSGLEGEIAQLAAQLKRISGGVDEEG